ncbi:polysaccharide lyase family 3 protein [Dothidotthia symphoricarpi CBS 119687]|uniref:Pectate lyase n=1 Tax=Dothidotthia symphoricarpi CBS 119687 TaxID=1392245 RepID=A0A6A6AIV6_9PLEO|nr:polysaccharide lyase family 3 protein [Dothidotthia symphoricarpi CBS 119687]KAF2131740.1 polysaccharide lyase family 3 protein [Dothidotthia symphoricarpi CBS 119687]
MKASVAASILAFAAAAAAGPSRRAPNNFFSLGKRSTLAIPTSQGSETLDAAMEVSGTFDGGMKTYGRGVSCTGQEEGDDSDAVFIIADGGSLKNVIIGEDQIEGVHCEGSCTIENVWWAAVCEDALSLKGDGDATITGGGATGAADKVIQHNGAGTVTIDGFAADDFGKLYRSCGNCKESAERHVVIKNVKVSNGDLLVGINSNFGDTATITDTCATSVSTICEEFEGTTPGNEPEEISSGVSAACIYTDPLPSC